MNYKIFSMLLKNWSSIKCHGASLRICIIGSVMCTFNDQSLHIHYANILINAL
jgi:hypothetical protein